MVELLPLVARYGPKTFNGPLKVPHLGELGMIEPQLENEMYIRLFQSLPSDDYVTFMNEFPSITLNSENHWYYWRLAGNNNKTISLIDWSDTLGNQPARVGQNQGMFYMYFAEDFFKQNDVITGNHPDDYQILVQEASREATNRYKLLCSFITDDPINKSIPDTEFTVGGKWSKETNFQSGERAYTGTEAHFTTFIEMKARAATQRMKYVVDGNMISAGKNVPLAFGLPDPKDPKNPKPYTGAFVNFYDAVARYQFRKQQARAFLFAHKNYTQNEIFYNFDSKNGCAIGTFAGMFKQFANTNVQPFTTLNLDRIADLTIEMGLAYKMADEYYVEIETGAYGKKDISQWLESRSTQYTPNWTMDRIKSNGDMGSQGLTYQGVFTQFKTYNGVNIKVKHRPFFDDVERYKEKHPSGYGLNSSRHMLVRNFIGDTGIYKLQVKGLEGGIFNYIPGMRNPFSQGAEMRNSGPSMTVSPVDAYEVHGQDWIGCVVKDPTKVLWMPYNQ